MEVRATNAAPLETIADTIVVGAFVGEPVAHDLPGEPFELLLRSGEAGQETGRVALIHAEGRRCVLVGLGRREEFTAQRARDAAGLSVAKAIELRAQAICWEVPHHVDETIVAALVEGCVLRSYRFDRYKRASDTARSPQLSSVVMSAHHDIEAIVERAAVLATAQNRVRDLGNRPANDLTPAALAEYAHELAGERAGLEVIVMDEDMIRDTGMGGFAAVAQGSDQPARLIRLDYNGTPDGPLLALVGKAVTFDTGGLWLKPKNDMHTMKFDMLGGAAVLEAMATLSDLQAPVRAMGVIGATENMISGGATRPGDIVTALDGTTIEINNTDAEGRLVLGDLITYSRRTGAAGIVDIATLTGGVVIALGSVYAGLMSNDDGMAALMQRAGQHTGELVWRLPLHEAYAEMIKGRYAQITNLTERREAQPITAAEFLHHFAGDVPWAHVDIAGTGDNVRSAVIADKGATGFGLRLLVEAALGWPRVAAAMQAV